MGIADARVILEEHDAAKARRAEQMPTEYDVLCTMSQCHSRLRELGWSEAIYCPKDGSAFDAIEFGSTGIHECTYDGEWPKGSWWIHDARDAWPSRPVMYRKRTPVVAVKPTR